MGLDIHVMRPRRFFQRDFELPIQRHASALGIPVQVVGATSLGEYEASMAEEAVLRQLRRFQVGSKYYVPDDSEIHFSERFSYDQFDLLREFAAHFDFPVKRYAFWGAKPFGDGYNLNTYPSLTAAWKAQKSAYPHLVFHDDNSGFYFPVSLNQPVKTDFGYLGSTLSLREELLMLSNRAPAALQHREAVTEAIRFLLQAVEASEKSGLPIIFDG